jgi:hypothetical protein
MNCIGGLMDIMLILSGVDRAVEHGCVKMIFIVDFFKK